MASLASSPVPCAARWRPWLTMALLDQIPADIVERIASFLPVGSLLCLEATNKRFNTCVRGAAEAWNAAAREEFAGGRRHQDDEIDEDSCHQDFADLLHLDRRESLDYALLLARRFARGSGMRPRLDLDGGRPNFVRLWRLRASFHNRIHVVEADISALGFDVDCLVVPSNGRLENPGMGALAAVFRTAGPELGAWLHSFRQTPEGESKFFHPGNVVVSPSFGRIRSKHILHAVGVHWWLGSVDEPCEGLAEKIWEQVNLTVSIFAKVKELDCKSVAIPGVSTGARRFPPQLFAAITMAAAKDAVLATEDLHVYCVSYGAVSLRSHFVEALESVREPLID